MSIYSGIEWTESTWNPVTGCTKVSDGCKNCYAERMSNRLKSAGNLKYINGFKITLHPNELGIPLMWKKPRNIFVASMSDLFHESIPFDYIESVFDIMHHANWHIFQILTKRSERLAELSPLLNWSNNIWIGVTVENNACVNRISFLKTVPAHVRFLSLEPLLEPIVNLDLNLIDWVIVGGESGPKSRPMRKKWVVDILTQCQESNVPFFFKQWGGVNKKKAGRLLEGKIYNEMPKFEASNLIFS